MIPEFWLIIDLVLLMCAAAIVVVARRSGKTHRSPAGDCSTNLTSG